MKKLIIISGACLLLSACKPKIAPEEWEIIFTEEENKAINQWKDKTLENWTDDSIAGNPAGLWLVGVAYLMAVRGFPLDIDRADLFFSLSGSLGFAPSLHQLATTIAANDNPLLAFVYFNLVISMGHPEKVSIYHKYRDGFISKGGIKVANEIEKIARYKRTIIDEWKNQYESNPKDFTKFMNSALKITDLDFLFDVQFWENIHSGKLVTGNIEIWIKKKCDELTEKQKSQTIKK